MRRARLRTEDLGSSVIRPAIAAAFGLLAAGEFVGRCWCEIDLVGLPAALLLDEEGNKSPAGWVSTGGDLALPADDDQVYALARQAAYAYARSAGLPLWDRPAGRGFSTSPLRDRPPLRRASSRTPTAVTLPVSRGRLV